MSAIANFEAAPGEALRPGPAPDYTQYRIVPARYPGRLVGTVGAVAAISIVLHSVLANPRWEWNVFAEWFFARPVLQGLWQTLLLTLLGAVLGFLLGTALALARVSGSPLLAWLAWAYAWLFRSIPLIVLLLVLNNLGYLYDVVTLGVPFTDLTFFSYPTTQLLTPFAVAVLGLTLNEAAFASEIIRGGILAVDQGQHEAAAALGLPRARQVWRVVLPQAMRSILPSGFNQIIGLAKGTSMVYILALPELFYTIQIIYHRNLEVIPLLMVATVWYLVILSVLSLIQHHIERHFARGALRNPPPSIIRRLYGQWRRVTEDGAALPLNAIGRTATLERGGEVKIHGISKSFNRVKVIDEVTLTVPASSVTVILGRSGSGKSTLLRAINHLERVDAGFVTVAGEFVGYRQEGRVLHELKERDILKRRADVGMVFQNFNLFPHMTALENITEGPLGVRGVARTEAVAQARGLLAQVGLDDKADAYPRQLSGGQQQRVAIARALALKPKVLLFDEPTSALDPELVAEVLKVIKELARSGTTMIVVTHEIGFAREVADQIVFMDEGRVCEVGTPDQMFNAPRHPRMREFLETIL
jgi:polar amino acid transport system permease protein